MAKAQSLARYKQQKLIVTTVLEELKTIADELNLPHASKEIQGDVKLLDDETFNLVVVGEFSRGKSTFINAMLGKTILPASSNPTTAVISKISYGTSPAFKLIYKDGRTETLGEESFKNLKVPPSAEDDCSDELEEEARQAEWVSGINYAQVNYPLSFCEDNVDIIDTPGVNDISQERVEITYRYLNKADAAIMLLSAQQTLTASEIAFLKEQIIGNQIENFFVVINFKDAIAEKNYQEVLDFTKEHLTEHLKGIKRFPPLFLVSSRQALTFRRKENGETLSMKKMLELPASLETTGFLEFEAALKDFLFEEKGRVKLQKYVSRGSNDVKQMNKYIATQILYLGKSTDEIKKKLNHLEPIFIETKDRAAFISNRLSVSLKNHESEILFRCSEGLGKIRDAAVKAVDAYNADMSRQELMEQVQMQIAPLQKNFYEELSKFQKEKITADINSALQKIQEVWSDVENEYNEERLPVKSDSQDATPDLSIKIDTDFDKGNQENVEGISLALTAGTLFVGSFLAPIFAIGCFAVGIGKVTNFINGFFVSLLGGSAESQLEKKKRSLREQIRSFFAKQEEQVQRSIQSSYAKNCEYVSNQIEKLLNGKVDDLKSQLNSIIDDKEKKDSEVAAKIKRLEALKRLLIKEQKILDEVLE